MLTSHEDVLSVTLSRMSCGVACDCAHLEQIAAELVQPWLCLVLIVDRGRGPEPLSDAGGARPRTGQQVGRIDMLSPHRRLCAHTKRAVGWTQSRMQNAEPGAMSTRHRTKKEGRDDSKTGDSTFMYM